MSDLRSKNLIVLKGIMFALIAAMAGWLLWEQSPDLRTACLIAVLIWSSCRFYYFLFYVLENYVDPTIKYAGIWSLSSELMRRGRRGSTGNDRRAP